MDNTGRPAFDFRPDTDNPGRNLARGAERTSPAAEAGRTAAAVGDKGRGTRCTLAAAGGRNRTRQEADTLGAGRIPGADTCCSCTVAVAEGGDNSCRRAAGVGKDPAPGSPGDAEVGRGCSSCYRCCCSHRRCFLVWAGGFVDRAVYHRRRGWMGSRGFRLSRGRLSCQGRSRVVGR